MQMNTIRWKVVHPKPELNSQSQHSKLKYQNISAEEDTSMYVSWVHKTQTGISRLILKPQAGQQPPPLPPSTNESHGIQAWIQDFW